MYNPIKLEIEYRNNICVLIISLNDTNNRDITRSDIMFFLVMIGNFFDNVQKQNIKFILVFDTRKIKNINFAVMTNVTSFFIKNKHVLKGNGIGSCIFIENIKASCKLISFLSNIYTPVRPVAIIQDDLNRDTFINDCIKNILENKVYTNKYYNINT